MKTAIIFFVAFFVLAVASAAGQDRRDFTVEEIKQIQKDERAELQTAQREQLKALTDMQTEETKEISRTGSNSTMIAFFDKQRDERKAILLRFADEREKLFALHNAERAAVKPRAR